MQFRFRYLRPGGQEAQVGTLEELRDLFRAGEVAPDTLLYDALTGEWAPLRAHAVGRLLQDVDEGSAPGAAAPVADDPPPAETGFELPGLALTLTDADVESPSTEDAVRELLKERERDDRGSDRDVVAFTAVPDGSDSLVLDAGFEASAPAEPSQPEPAPRPARREAKKARSSRSGPAASKDEPGRGRAPAAPRRPVQVPVTPPPRPRRRRSPGRALAAVASAGLLALVLYAVAWSEDDPNPSSDLSALAAAAPAPAVPVRTAASMVDAAESVALGEMVEALDSLRVARRLDEVPADWLEGVYLANASRYPEVRSHWERYAAFVDEVRQRDTALFRQSFVRRLHAEGATGSVVAMRLARAVRLFEESQPARETVYEAMAELARASLDLHDLLVRREAEIHYDPVRPHRVSRDPVVEAVTDDAELRDRMWRHLDRIFYSLQVLSGGEAGTRDALTERSLDGIRATGGF